MTENFNTPTSDELKETAKIIKDTLKTRFGVEIKHGWALEVSSAVYGFKNWDTASAIVQIKQDYSDLHAISEKDLIRHYLAIGMPIDDANELARWEFNLTGGLLADAMLDYEFINPSNSVLFNKVEIFGYFLMLMCELPYGDEGIEIFLDTKEWREIYGPEIIYSETLMTRHVAAVLGMEYDEAVTVITKERNRFKAIAESRKG